MIGVLDLWRDLSSASRGAAGIVRRRVLPDSGRDIYVAIAEPGGERMLVLSVAPSDAPPVNELPATRAIRSTLVYLNEHQAEIRVILSSDDMLMVFASFVEDVATCAARELSDAGAVRALLDRFAHWRRLLAGDARSGLRRDEAQGLWAELWVLRHVLHPKWGNLAVSAWTGYGRDAKDFRLERVAVEVKSTRSYAPLAVEIHGEGQLDLADGVLLLAVLDIDGHEQGSGESLSDMVATVRSLLSGSDIEMLDQKLTSYGYRDDDSDLYTAIKYALQAIYWHHVAGAFPRITASQLPDGVGHVNYLLSLDACVRWRVEDQALDDLLELGASA